ncbi:hypothetical protein VIGAN_06045300 [Vigna angularis var. angularis]|uniref:PGG domain-containing protein n=1 Tax=Vigna angularis var. angularis TaxID=157739 RepID=A0A0S3S9D9_PHAAN|nr:hypothetical protein VIGAN_06045300 [Vigna angularis var. angularis]
MQSVYWVEFAARQGDVNSLYEIIENDPCVLEAIDSIPFVESPLHVAARAGQVQFAAEIMTLKPSFAWKFNPQGRRPIHLALENGDTAMVLQLINMDKELVRDKRREGLTLLHLASESGDIHLLTEFLRACPDSVKDLTVRNETALHFAVKNRRLDTFRFLLRWLTTNTVELQAILNQKDVDGNTILHIAATNNDTEAMRLLMENMTDLDAANLSGETAFDIIKDEEIKNNLARAEARVKIRKKVRSLIVSMREWLIRKTGNRGNMSDEIRRVYLIVATLVATATYNAAVSPPGGVHQAAGTNNTAIHVASNSSKVYEGKSVMSTSNFMLFSITNSEVPGQELAWSKSTFDPCFTNQNAQHSGKRVDLAEPSSKEL